MSAPWSTLELAGLSESDKKLILQRVQQELATNPQIKKILRRATKQLKDRLQQKPQVAAGNITAFKKGGP